MATDAEIIQAARKLEAAIADSDAANSLLVKCQTELSRAETAAHAKEMLVKECRYNMTRLLTPISEAWSLPSAWLKPHQDRDKDVSEANAIEGVGRTTDEPISVKPRGREFI